MAESWCKVASDLDSDPKIRRAGRAGREVFLFVLRRNAMPGNPIEGRVSELELAPWYLADQLMLTEQEAITGVTACVTAALLVRDGDSYVIAGWDPKWGKEKSSNAERQARHREKKKRLRDLANYIPQSVTASNTTSNTSDVTSNVDQRRLEEIRSPDLSLRARAIQPTRQYDADDPAQRGRLTRELYDAVSDARVRIAAELDMASVLPFPPVTPATRPAGYRDLALRIAEEGASAPMVTTRVLEALIAQARDNKSVEWLSEKAFTEGGWRTAREAIPGWRGTPARGRSLSAFDAADEVFDAMKQREAQ